MQKTGALQTQESSIKHVSLDVPQFFRVMTLYPNDIIFCLRYQKTQLV